MLAREGEDPLAVGNGDRLIEHEGRVIDDDVTRRGGRIRPDTNRVARGSVESQLIGRAVVPKSARRDVRGDRQRAIDVDADQTAGAVGGRVYTERVRSRQRRDDFLIQPAIEELRRPTRAVLRARARLVRLGLGRRLTEGVV